MICYLGPGNKSEAKEGFWELRTEKGKVIYVLGEGEGEGQGVGIRHAPERELCKASIESQSDLPSVDGIDLYLHTYYHTKKLMVLV